MVKYITQWKNNNKSMLKVVKKSFASKFFFLISKNYFNKFSRVFYKHGKKSSFLLFVSFLFFLPQNDIKKLKTCKFFFACNLFFITIFFTDVITYESIHLAYIFQVVYAASLVKRK